MVMIQASFVATRFALAACLLAQWATAQDVAEPSLHARLLAAAVDEPTAEARAAAANDLAKRDRTTLDQWRAAMLAFEPLDFEAEEGLSVHEVKLFNEGSGESELTRLAIYVPASLDRAKPAPLIVALHGTGGRGDVSASRWGRIAESLGALVLAPSEAGANSGFSGEPRERASVVSAMRWMRRRFNIDENRVWLLGYSRGGHLAWDLAVRQTTHFAGAFPLAGGPRFGSRPVHNNLRFTENLANSRLRLIVGDADDPQMLVNIAMVDALVERAKIADRVTLEVLPRVGHIFDPMQGRDWPALFDASLRDPWRPEVVLNAARNEEARTHWLRIDEFTDDVQEDFDPIIRARGGRVTDQTKLKKLVLDVTLRKTARVEAQFKKQGEFRVEAFGAKRISLFVNGDQIAKTKKGEWKKALIKVNGKTVRVAAEPSVAVLLGEFVRRFDRTFLPEAALEFAVTSRKRR